MRLTLRSVGPLLGGAFADPAKNLGYAGPGGIFATYPWLLPCLLSAAVNLGACFLAYFALDETYGFGNHSAEHSPDEVDPLLPQNQATEDTSLCEATSGSRWKQAAALLSSACVRNKPVQPCRLTN
jgi:hypothetical protein